ncbi:MAG TPA: HAMP domain-containing sensor histidine kinase [Pseudobacteroides sp.]|uniref:sensor histidine kinase n=1 Tax=Pseudobacteroides sp. TaxID=1968840 RepID=UPI002F9444E3
MCLLNLIKLKKAKGKDYRSTGDIKINSELDALRIRLNMTQDILCKREAKLHSDNEENKNYNNRIKELYQLKNDIAKFITGDIGIYLNSIIRYTSNLLKENWNVLSSEEVKRLLKIRAESKELLGAIGNANLVVKTENFKVEPKKDLFNIIEVVDEIVSGLMNTILKKNLSFERILYSEESIPIYSDRLKFRRILTDVLSYSIQNASQGTIRLMLDIKESNYCIRIQDEGNGMTKEELDFIFDEFLMFNDKSYISKRAISMEMSLCNVKQLVELLGGCIEVESKEGEGSCFTIYLPVGN